MKKKLLVGTVNGCFDVLHIGHVRFLKEAKKHCDILVVLINSDEYVKRKKHRLIHNELERTEQLLALRSVDNVLVFNSDTPDHMLKCIGPDFHFKTKKSVRRLVNQERQIVEARGGKLIYLPVTKGFSTSRIVETK